MVQGPKGNFQGPDLEVEGLVCEKKKRTEGGCKVPGVGTEKDQGKP